MKKLFIAMGMALMLGLASCGGNEIDRKLDQLEDIKEKAEKLKTEDPTDPEVQAEALKIVGEVMEIANDLKNNKDQMTDAQKERLQELMKN